MTALRAAFRSGSEVVAAGGAEIGAAACRVAAAAGGMLAGGAGNRLATRGFPGEGGTRFVTTRRGTVPRGPGTGRRRSRTSYTRLSTLWRSSSVDTVNTLSSKAQARRGEEGL